MYIRPKQLMPPGNYVRPSRQGIGDDKSLTKIRFESQRPHHCHSSAPPFLDISGVAPFQKGISKGYQVIYLHPKARVLSLLIQPLGQSVRISNTRCKIPSFVTLVLALKIVYASESPGRLDMSQSGRTVLGQHSINGVNQTGSA